MDMISRTPPSPRMHPVGNAMTPVGGASGHPVGGPPTINLPSASRYRDGLARMSDQYFWTLSPEQQLRSLAARPAWQRAFDAILPGSQFIPERAGSAFN